MNEVRIVKDHLLDKRTIFDVIITPGLEQDQDLRVYISTSSMNVAEKIKDLIEGDSVLDVCVMKVR